MLLTLVMNLTGKFHQSQPKGTGLISELLILIFVVKLLMKIYNNKLKENI